MGTDSGGAEKPCLFDLPALLYGPFDVVVMWEVIDHFINPNAVLVALAQRLDDCGVLALSTPCLDHPIHRVLGYDDPMWNVPGHLIYYDKASLEAALLSAGLVIVDRRYSQRHLGSVMVICTAAGQRLQDRVRGRAARDRPATGTD